MAEGEGIGSAWKIIPSLSSRDIAATVDFYTSELGFTLGGTKPENGDDSPLYFCSVYTGNKAAANIYFFLCEPNEFHPGGVMIALGTAGLDQFHDLLLSKGNVEVVEAIRDTPWGYRQFTIKDNDGNRLTFFKFLEGGNPGTD
ncbi:glyoxalase family protein [Colletotrichum melonis]|uniref:Glyoxalase family protein n=2 Tax=Colletotrichum acutatum species complex TaxID=2707335 RepID=A0AAI9XNR2_9PEZI|nr:glyoxalase family protein [Colletotrichum tamarilloi]KAK1454645.1 glyoxalase family protein [Colletotrichum melonis]KAK1506017.1 glyoxalase family protein [Colletotrichum tamarilloi]KAK1719632.1 glyoxalase family protein [Colletotrichum lupini]